MRKEIVPVTLESGRRILVEVAAGGDEDVAESRFALGDIEQSVIDIANTVFNVLRKVRPTSAEVEFGVSVGIESGKLTALLVQGTASATLKITLTWDDETDGSGGHPV